jgi:hypothetical protein
MGPYRTEPRRRRRRCRRPSLPLSLAWVYLASACSGAATETMDASSGQECGPVATDGAVNPSGDGGACMILASNYDQSCRVDSDCILIAQGNYCTPGCLCREGVVNYGALPRFVADVSKAPIAADAMSAGDAGCPCLVPSGPCCRAGMCQLGARCQNEGGACR